MLLREQIQWDTQRKLPVLLRSVKRSEGFYDLIITTIDGEVLVDEQFSTPPPHSTVNDQILTNLNHLSKIENGTRSTGSGKTKHNIARSQIVLLMPTNGEQGIFRLQIQISWRTTTSFSNLNFSLPKKYRDIYAFACPDISQSGGGGQGSSPELFYKCVHVPQNVGDAIPGLPSEELPTQLYPFQQRSVRWLLRREGVEVGENGALLPYNGSVEDGLWPSFDRRIDEDGREYFYNHLYRIVSKSLDGFVPEANSFHGGILAEEMGMPP